MSVAVESDPVRAYYGSILSSRHDLKTGACCPPDALPAVLQVRVNRIHPEILERFYGCGAPIPPLLEGCRVLDLGCGTGRDCYLLSQLVGPEGAVVGVDMTREQLDVARRHQEWHARAFGHPASNVTFLEGYMERLAALGIEDDSFDLVVSNCVFNLSPAKADLFEELFRVLRPGGELHFSDIVADRRVPSWAMDDPVLRGECLAGATYLEDLRRLMADAGFADVRQRSQAPVPLLDPELEARLGQITFTSRTFRAFKLELEDRCEDYGQVATYLGTIPDHPHRFSLDQGHLFERGRPERVCGNTASMLQETRYAPHFEVTGDRSVHFGLFDCTPGGGADSAATTQGACC